MNQEYFETLVLSNQAKTSQESEFYRQRLAKLLKSKPDSISKLTPSKRTPDSVIKEWYSTAVLVLSDGRSMEDAISKARVELKLPALDIKKSIEEFIELGLLKLNDGVLSISAQYATVHDPKSLSALQERFLHSQLKQSMRAFQKTYSKKQGKFLSHTLTLPPAMLDVVHGRFLSLMEDLTKDMDAQGADGNTKVAQINIQLFHPQRWNDGVS